MAIRSDHRATSEGNLENIVWARYVGEHRGDKVASNDEQEVLKSWKELPGLDSRDGSMEVLNRKQRPSSLSSKNDDNVSSTTTSQGYDSSCTSLGSGDEVSVIPRRRVSRDWEANNDFIIMEQPGVETMACVEELSADDFWTWGVTTWTGFTIRKIR
ncbi:hypothetical protein SADUNF_Sadunf11G0038900 [Salix dunnii]|uniref:Uncharacterized protein n=1 Tax=Salix dunnii TaxID=1413687 RepID=A0A835MT16_9ROSI|nr:hypothetical protein SADUNF_Sadunf11G0038900 [Salix dunnii]